MKRASDSGWASVDIRALLSAHQWRSLAVAGTVAVALLIVCGLSSWRATKELLRLDTRRENLIRELQADAKPDGEAPASSAAPDFTQQLPASPDIRAVVAEVERASSAASVQLAELTSQSRPGTTRTLAASELSLRLRGAYPQIKRVLIEVRARYPYVTVRRASLRRGSSSQDIEASVVLTVWARPVYEQGGGR